MGVTMEKEVIEDELRSELISYLKRKRKPDLINSYFFFLSKKYKLDPIVSPRHKMIFRNLDEALTFLSREGRLWRETRIRIGQERSQVDELTQKIYICPFSGKVFADNTHPNPQDAIYEWVANCPENTERKDGLVVKRFYVSEDPEIIQNYIQKCDEPITKVVFSSALTGAIFNSKEAIIEEFKKNYIKPITLEEIQNQNRFEIEEEFLHFIQEQLVEEKISQFVETLAQYEPFLPYIQKWLES